MKYLISRLSQISLLTALIGCSLPREVRAQTVDFSGMVSLSSSPDPLYYRVVSSGDMTWTNGGDHNVIGDVSYTTEGLLYYGYPLQAAVVVILSVPRTIMPLLGDTNEPSYSFQDYAMRVTTPIEWTYGSPKSYWQFSISKEAWRQILNNLGRSYPLSGPNGTLVYPITAKVHVAATWRGYFQKLNLAKTIEGMQTWHKSSDDVMIDLTKSATLPGGFGGMK